MKSKAVQDQENSLRKEVKKLMIDLDMDLPREREVLADRISIRLGRRIKVYTLYMALSGFRTPAPYLEILETARDILSSELKRC